MFSGNTISEKMATKIVDMAVITIATILCAVIDVILGSENKS